MSKENKSTSTRRNVLAGLSATGVGLTLGVNGVAAGEKNNDAGDYDVPVAIDWQEAFTTGNGWKKIEAFPDENNDAVQDDDIDYCNGGMTNGSLVDIEDPFSDDLRTNNDYTDPGDPLINFHGIKPGYGGEVTLSYHLCDEPGKLKLMADDVTVDKKLAHLARARVWYDEFDGAKPPNGGNNGTPPTNGSYPMVNSSDGPVTEETPQIDEIIVTGDDQRFGGARNYDCDDYEEQLSRFEDGDLEGSEVFGSDFEAGDTAEGCATITVTARSSGSVTLSSDGPVTIVSIKGGNEGEQVYVFDGPVILDNATFSTPTSQGISNIDVCCTENDNNGNGGNGGNGGNDNGNGHDNRGDNVYQEYEPIIVQGSLKKVLHKLKKGVPVSGDPYVAGPFDQEGIHYYGYPRVNTSDCEIASAEEYVPKWITVENVEEFVDGKKIKEIVDSKNIDDLGDCIAALGDGIELCIDGVGHVAMDKDSPLPDLCIEITKIIKGKKGKPVGFEWESNLPICRIEIAGGDRTKLNVFDRACEGTALAPLYDDNGDNHGRRRPITGVRFGVCGDHDEDDWCIENSNTGYIGFEWWIPKHVGLKEKGKIHADLGFVGKPC